MSKKAFLKALKVVGGTGVMARKLKVKQSRVSNWKRRGVPDREVLNVEAATVDEKTGQVRVSRHELNRQLYPKENTRAHATG